MTQLDLPTLNRIHEVRNKSQAIGEFLEWLGEQGIILCKWQERHQTVCFRCGAKTDRLRALFERGYSDPEDPQILCKACLGDGYQVEHSGFYPASTSINSLLHSFFDIDPVKEETERRAILEQIRANK